MSEPIKTIKDLESKFRKAKTGVSDDTVFTANAIMFLAYEIIKINKTLIKVAERIKKAKKREPSAYNLFIAEQRANGKSFEEAIELYREYKK